jgi:uncharacterized protein YpbB
MKQIKDKIHAMYLDWVNNFITIARFAECYSLSEKDAERVINIGRVIHDQNVQTYKLTGIEP